MKRYGYLFEQVACFYNLHAAALKVLKGKKSTTRAAQFYFNMEYELLLLEKELLSGTYRPRPYFAFNIFDPKYRHICAADIRDRVVHHAVCRIIEPVFDKTMIYDTFACRTGKGVHAAVRRAQSFCRRYAYYLQCDIAGYFDHVDHAVLKRLLGKKLKDNRLMALLYQIIEHPVPGACADKGIPIGNLTSQLFANLYLSPLDHYVKETLRNKGYVRYMDDFVLFADDKATLHQWLADLRRFLDRQLKLSVKQRALRIAPTSTGIGFLGFLIYPCLVRMRRNTRTRFVRNARKRIREYLSGHIEEDQLAQSINGMIAHVMHANTHRFRAHFF